MLSVSIRKPRPHNVTMSTHLGPHNKRTAWPTHSLLPYIRLWLCLFIISKDLEVTDKACNISSQPLDHTISLLAPSSSSLPLFNHSFSLFIITRFSVSTLGSSMWMSVVRDHLPSLSVDSSWWHLPARIWLSCPGGVRQWNLQRQHHPLGFVMPPVFLVLIRVILNDVAQLGTNRAEHRAAFTV